MSIKSMTRPIFLSPVLATEHVTPRLVLLDAREAFSATVKEVVGMVVTDAGDLDAKRGPGALLSPELMKCMRNDGDRFAGSETDQ